MDKHKKLRKLLVTSALPYANGSLHLGHLLELIQTDIWVRFQRLSGNDCKFVCADDAHGTGISLHANKEKITPEQLIEQVHNDRLQDFLLYDISFDHYHSTHSPENKFLVEHIFMKLLQSNKIVQKEITQLYDITEQRFLADRYVKGTCPKCKSKEQYGDNCEQCGCVYSPLDLIEPYSVLSGSKPITKKSRHYFFTVGKFESQLKDWVYNGSVTEDVANKLKEWLETKLEDWTISRDAPYFGFKIPNENDKYFYVWLDAPIGYMASFKYLCNNTGLDFDEYWNRESKVELHHFIGKDIINFHCLFWPAILECADFRKPTKVHVHGYLTIQGEKMSKSRGTFITAKHYAKHLPTELLRYYFATKLSPKVVDIDFNINDFVQKVNSDLVGKVINLLSRCIGFINKQFNGQLGELCLEAQPLLVEFELKRKEITNYYEEGSFSKAMSTIMHLADLSNSWINDVKPWVVAKDMNKQTLLQQITTTGCYLYKILIGLLKPVLTSTAKKSELILNISPLTINNCADPFKKGHLVNEYEPLLTRVNKEKASLILE